MSTRTGKLLRFEGDRALLETSKEAAERCGFKEGEELSVFSPGGQVLLLAGERSKHGFFVGRLETFSSAEVFGFICSAIRSGTLILQGAASRRRIGFSDGQVIFAASSDTTERLGPVLLHHGLVTREQLRVCEDKVTAGARLGKLLIEQGFLTPAQLYRGMQLQAKEIVLNAFLENEGEFAFIEGETGETNLVKLAERTRDLVLAGMNRAEQLTLLRQKFPDAATLSRGSGEPDGPAQTAAFDKVDGVRAVREVIYLSRLGEFSALQALDGLVSRGAVAVQKPKGQVPSRPPYKSVSAEGAGALQLYKQAIHRICQELNAAGELPRLDSFFTELAEGHRKLFAGVHIKGGELDVEVVANNGQKVHKGAMGRAMALEALDAFVTFALFDARNVLPSAKAAELAREVGKLVRAHR